MRLNAAILLLALVPMVFPADWMGTIHYRLQLGDFPTTSITEYLTRSASACYALHGGVVWLISRDVRRYRPMIRPLYLFHLLFAGTMLGIDLYSGMPTWWIVAEVGTISTFALVVLFVERRRG